MKVIHVIESLDLSTGGPARSVTMLVDKLITNEDTNCYLITRETVNPIAKFLGKKNKEIHFVKNVVDLIQLLKANNDKQGIIYHGHGIWQLFTHFMSFIARKNSIPYVISTRGMLEPWSLGQSPIKKKIALWLFQKRDLNCATVIHATSQMEKANLRKLGFKNAIAVIPNGICLDIYPIEPPNKSLHPRKILFLSRIHKKKGIENLLEAWFIIPEALRNGWQIEIIGNGNHKYIRELQAKILKLNLSNSILILPPEYSNNKIMRFREASLFVLPSYSENFGIAIAEALASYTPVITTFATPWDDVVTFDCGWWIDVGVIPLKMALLDAISSSDDKLKQMGRNGRALIESKYNVESVAMNMNELYNWLDSKKNIPKFVDVGQS